MTNLIQGHTTLKRSKTLHHSDTTYVYRLMLGLNGYIVHVEHLFSNGGGGEMILYQGDDLKRANWCYNFYSKE